VRRLVITKHKSGQSVVKKRGSVTTERSWGSSTSSLGSYRFTEGDSDITYGEGPKYLNYRCNWKPCEQNTKDKLSGNAHWFFNFRGWYKQSTSNIYNLDCKEYVFEPSWIRSQSLPPLSGDLSETWNKIWDNLDLNARDPVLLYSGIVQAVPLVGGALNFVSVMNRAARKLSKSFKQKPFTTVVKSMISLDFIDRFVVSPTIDDARKFLNAHNYVVNVMNTMYARSQPLPTAISASTTSGSYSTKSTYFTSAYSNSDMRPYSSPRVYGTLRSGTVNTTECFLLAELDYNTSSVDPIKLWAARCGIMSPLDSVWDLVPFSFVIDYFTRAGDFISGLGREMSSQDGLKGTVRRIHGAWSTIKSFRGTTFIPNADDFSVSMAGGWTTGSAVSGVDGSAMSFGSYRFSRRPVNPWNYPLEDPSGLLRLDLSQTRVRTLLELLIQAKL